MLSTLVRAGCIAHDLDRRFGRAEELSITDGLTGVYNYRYLRSALDKEIARAKRFTEKNAVARIARTRTSLARGVSFIGRPYIVFCAAAACAPGYCTKTHRPVSIRWLRRLRWSSAWGRWSARR